MLHSLFRLLLVKTRSLHTQYPQFFTGTLVAVWLLTEQTRSLNACTTFNIHKKGELSC